MSVSGDRQVQDILLGGIRHIGDFTLDTLISLDPAGIGSNQALAAIYQDSDDYNILSVVGSNSNVGFV